MGGDDLRSHVNTWTTNDLEQSDRYHAWTCMLKEAYGQWEADRPREPDFFGTVKYYDDAVLKIIDCTCDPCGGKRTRAGILTDGLETLTIQLVIEGNEYIDFNGEEIILKQGDILVWDSTKPMTFQVQDRLHKISVVLPLQRFQSWLPRSWFSIRHSIDGHTHGGAMLSNHIESLSTCVFDGGCEDNHSLIDATIGVLVNALDVGKTGEPAPLRVTQLANIKKYIEANLSNPALSPEIIAKAGGMSTRYLHWLFHSNEETVNQYIFRKRLDLCARDLSNPHMHGRKISDIAFYWGFQDTTHFNKKFRQQFNESPGAFRKKFN